MGEAIPFVSPDLAPGCLALYLGCTCIEQTDTVWFQPCMKERMEQDFRYDQNNFYWQFTLRLAHEQLRIGKDRFILQFPDLIEGLDTLAAMRGSEILLTDVIEDPDWIQLCLRQITDRYFHYYDMLYDLIRDDVGGSYFWIWAPGRMAKLQCDFSAMIGPDMFKEFMVPVLHEMCQRVSYSLYHWDGPGALPHFEHLLGIEELDMIQWVPGDGHELPDHPRWWHLYHRMLECGKKVFIHYCPSSENLKALKKEFGKKLNQFFIIMHAKTVEEADELLKISSN
jgi:5-methyltetrahydrofolate--homocysteine methyltransferase